MNKQKLICMGFLALGLSVCLCACGGFGTKNGNGAVSGGAVSASAVSGEAVGVEDTEGRHIYANDTNFYMSTWADDFEDLESETVSVVGYQKKDVTKREEIQIDDFLGLLCVSDEGIYYCKEDSSGKDAYGLWRMPIQKNEDGTDHLLKENEEKLLVEKDGIIVDNRGYADDRYIVYFTYEGDVVKYDFKTGKESRHKLQGNIASLEPVSGHNLIIANEYAGFYRWNLDSDTWELFAEEKSACDVPAATNGDYYFYSRTSEGSWGDEIWKYDIKTGKKSVFLSEEQISQACEKVVTNKGGNFEWNGMHKLFCQGDRLYVELQLDWKKEKEYRMNYVIFSVDLQGETELDLERELMDYIEQKSSAVTWKTKAMKGCDRVVWNSGCCEYIVDGKVIFILNSKNQVGCFDLADGTFQKVSNKDENYYLPYYDYNASEAYADWIMDNSMSFIPVELDGYFGE